MLILWTSGIHKIYNSIKSFLHVTYISTSQLLTSPSHQKLIAALFTSVYLFLYLTFAPMCWHFSFVSNNYTFLAECYYKNVGKSITCFRFFLKWLVEYNAALASICFMTLLGFVDDVLDVPWRVWVLLMCLLFSIMFIITSLVDSYLLLCTFEDRKLVLPSVAALPLLMAYAGHTTIVIPKPLVPYVGLEILDLGK